VTSTRLSTSHYDSKMALNYNLTEIIQRQPPLRANLSQSPIDLRGTLCDNSDQNFTPTLATVREYKYA